MEGGPQVATLHHHSELKEQLVVGEPTAALLALGGRVRSWIIDTRQRAGKIVAVLEARVERIDDRVGSEAEVEGESDEFLESRGGHVLARGIDGPQAILPARRRSSANCHLGLPLEVALPSLGPPVDHGLDAGTQLPPTRRR